MFKRFNWYNKFGTLPSDYREAMSYEEQILWLCQQIDDLKSQTGNYNYELLLNKPKINNIELNGNVSLNTLGIQPSLIAGSGITISGNVISATSGGGGGTTYPIRVLTDNIVLEDYQIPALEEALYFIPSGTNIYYNSLTSNNAIFETNDIVFWDSENRIFSNGTKYVNYSTIDRKWTFGENLPKNHLTSDIYLTLDGKIKDSSFNDVKLNPNVYSTALYKIYKQINVSESVEILGNFKLFYFTEIIDGIKEIYTDDGEWYFDLDSNAWIFEGKNYVNNLSDNIVLEPDTPLTLASGFYRFSDSQKGLYYLQALTPNLIYGYNDGVFYFDNATQTFNLDLKSWYYDSLENDWVIAEHTNITNEIINNRDKIPTSQAVYNALQNISPSGASVTSLTENLILLANTQISLQAGLYFTGLYKIYLHSATSENVLIGNNELVYIPSGSIIVSDNYNITLVDEGGTIDWVFDTHSGITNVLVNDDTMIATSGAVYNAINNLHYFEELKYNDSSNVLNEFRDSYVFIKTFRDSSNNVINVDQFFHYVSNHWEQMVSLSSAYASASNNGKDYNFAKWVLNYNGSVWQMSSTNEGITTLNQNVSINNATGTGDNHALVNVKQVKDYVTDKLSYSSSEKIIGTWINGKPLYEKVVECSVPTVTTDGTAENTYQNLDSTINFVFIKNTIAFSSGATYPNLQALPYINNAGLQLKAQIVPTSSNLPYRVNIVSNGTAYNNYNKILVIINYTKNTD